MKIYSSLKIFSIRIEITTTDFNFYQWQIVELDTEKVICRYEEQYTNPATAMRDCLYVVCGDIDTSRKNELGSFIKNSGL